MKPQTLQDQAAAGDVSMGLSEWKTFTYEISRRMTMHGGIESIDGVQFHCTDEYDEGRLMRRIMVRLDSLKANSF